MMEPHLHCGECGKTIETQLVRPDGTAVDVEVRVGSQLAVVQSPDGQLAVQPRPVPLCDGCYELITQEQRIIVPKPVLATQ